MVLQVLVRRVWFDALDDVRFPDAKAANVLRGGFGHSLRATATPAVYEQIFEPKLEGPGPSGLADPPRPFLFRASHLDGQRIAKHDDFSFDIHIFGAAGVAETITGALQHLFEKGAGVGRGKAKLTAIADERIDLPMLATETASRVKVTFLTPTELKHQGRVVTQPDFPILIRRVRDRVATLMSLYGPGEPKLDFQSFGQAADEVRTVRADINVQDVARTSSRTGQTHTIGGMVGDAEYVGRLDAFLPFLRAAQYTGVGRHTVWGNGCIQTEIVAR